MEQVEWRWRALTSDFDITDDVGFKNLEMGYHHHMLPTSNQPARIYASAKTHKSSSADRVNINDLMFRPIIDQACTMTYNAAKVISEYLRTLCKSKYNINDILSFAGMTKHLPPLQDDRYISYDVVLLFTNIPLDETINHIIESIYTDKYYHKSVVS